MNMNEYCETCRKLGLGRWHDGAHSPVDECEARPGGCSNPQEHHEPRPQPDHSFIMICTRCGLEITPDDQWLDHGPCRPCSHAHSQRVNVNGVKLTQCTLCGDILS